MTCDYIIENVIKLCGPTLEIFNKYKKIPKSCDLGSIIFLWLDRQDSNLRMLGPKPSALPLGDDPICYILARKLIFHNKIGANGMPCLGSRSKGVVLRLDLRV